MRLLVRARNWLRQFVCGIARHPAPKWFQTEPTTNQRAWWTRIVCGYCGFVHKDMVWSRSTIERNPLAIADWLVDIWPESEGTSLHRGLIRQGLGEAIIREVDRCAFS